MTYKEIDEILNDKRKNNIALDFIRKYLNILQHRNRRLLKFERELNSTHTNYKQTVSPA
jgi:hypothetical protein